MKGYNIARVPEHIWDLPGEGQRVRGADFNVAAWIRVDSFGDSEVMADEVVLLVQHEDEAGNESDDGQPYLASGDGLEGGIPDALGEFGILLVELRLDLLEDSLLPVIQRHDLS